MKANVIRNFNNGASTYHDAAGLQADIAQQLASRLANASVRNILEIGSGTGLLSKHLVSLFPAADLLLTDIAPAMVTICQNTFSQQSQVSYQCIDGESISTEKRFDLIASSMVLHWFENLHDSFNNITQHLLPGGRFEFAMLSENSLLEWREMCAQFNIHSKRLFPSNELIQKSIPGMHLEIKKIQQPYQSAFDFLSSLKQLGVRATTDGQSPDSPSKLRKLIRHYKNEIVITYEVIFGSYVKA